MHTRMLVFGSMPESSSVPPNQRLFLKMNSKEAKDFLVQQVAEQAALENLPFSDLEKRMMYFTESDPASCDKPFELNDEFEAQHDNAEYEAKVSQLLQHAHGRVAMQNAEMGRMWDEAVGELRKGDHYLLVLLDEKPHASVLLRTAWNGLLTLVGMSKRPS